MEIETIIYIICIAYIGSIVLRTLENVSIIHGLGAGRPKGEPRSMYFLLGQKDRMRAIFIYYSPAKRDRNTKTI